MSEDWDPSWGPSVSGAKKRMLELRSTLSFTRGGDTHAVLLTPMKEKRAGWLARIQELDERYALVRSFLQGRFGYEEGWNEDRYLEYELTEPGLYEACSWIRVPGAAFDAVRVCFTFEPDSGFRILSRQAFDAACPTRDVDFGDVRALVATRDFDAAARAARMMTDDVERESAQAYVSQSRTRTDGVGPELQGSEKQVRWAQSLRRAVLSSISDSLSNSPDEELALAQQWLLTQTSARFFIDTRDHLETLEGVRQLTRSLTELEPLRGSRKQVQWASTIRATALSTIEREGRGVSVAQRNVLERFRAESSAKFFIDARDHVGSVASMLSYLGL